MHAARPLAHLNRAQPRSPDGRKSTDPSGR